MLNTVFVRNLPEDVSESSLETVFSHIGPVKRCFTVSDPGSSKCKGFGYVTFSLSEDADKATKETLWYENRKLNIILADVSRNKSRTKNKKRKIDDVDVQSEKNPVKIHSESSTVILHGIKDGSTPESINRLIQNKIGDVEASVTCPIPDRGPTAASITFTSKKSALEAVHKLSGKSLRAVLMVHEQKYKQKCKLIVRNISFKIKEKDIHEAFSKFGRVEEIVIPKKDGSKIRGFCFVRFSTLSEASKALSEMNGSTLKDRPIAVDWTVPKSQYLLTQEDQTNPTDNSDIPIKTEIKQEKNTDFELQGEIKTEIKTENDSDFYSDSSDDQSVNDDSDLDPDDKGDLRSVTHRNNEASESKDFIKLSSGSDNSCLDTEDESSDEFSNSDDDESDNYSPNKKIKVEKGIKTPVKRKDDTVEGKTLFIRNLSFDTEEDQLEEELEEFGEVQYVKIVIDKDTDHPKGTAFVRFSTKEEADSCISSANEGEGIVLDGRRLNFTVAVSREKAQQMTKEKKEKEVKDKRNLYLIREGMIRPGTIAAEGLSASDLAKRSKLEQQKKMKLKNPNIFVSTTRLCFCNLPVSLTDGGLKKLILQSLNEKAAKITECRIMRNLKTVNSKGVGKSLGYAFVNFSEHEHALKALRATNNNPTILPKGRRMIVEFSLENKAALNAKQKKLERYQNKQMSFEKNKDPAKVPNKAKSAVPSLVGRLNKPTGLSKSEVKKLPKGLPSHWGPKIRHKPRNHQQKQQKPTPISDRQDLKSETKPKKTKKRNRKGKKQNNKVDSFDKLVESYKQITKGYRSKWFE